MIKLHPAIIAKISNFGYVVPSFKRNRFYRELAEGVKSGLLRKISTAGRFHSGECIYVLADNPNPDEKILEIYIASKERWPLAARKILMDKLIRLTKRQWAIRKTALRIIKAVKKSKVRNIWQQVSRALRVHSLSRGLRRFSAKIGYFSHKLGVCNKTARKTVKTLMSAKVWVRHYVYIKTSYGASLVTCLYVNPNAAKWTNGSDPARRRLDVAYNGAWFSKEA